MAAARLLIASYTYGGTRTWPWVNWFQFSTRLRPKGIWGVKRLMKVICLIRFRFSSRPSWCSATTARNRWTTCFRRGGRTLSEANGVGWARWYLSPYLAEIVFWCLFNGPFWVIDFCMVYHLNGLETFWLEQKKSHWILMHSNALSQRTTQHAFWFSVFSEKGSDWLLWLFY